jgi:hypothetical protein
MAQRTAKSGRRGTVFDWRQLRIFRAGVSRALCGGSYLKGIDEVYKRMHTLAGNRDILKTTVSCDYIDISYSLLCTLRKSAVVGT